MGIGKCSAMHGVDPGNVQLARFLDADEPVWVLPTSRRTNVDQELLHCTVLPQTATDGSYWQGNSWFQLTTSLSSAPYTTAVFE